MLVPVEFTFSLIELVGFGSALHVKDNYAGISYTYSLYIENGQYCLYICEKNYRAKELIKYLLDNKLATIKQKGYNYITFIFLQLTPLMLLYLC